MRKNATKIAAMALTLALTVTSVTLPSNTASAAKKTGLNKTKATLYADAGKTTYAQKTKKNTTTLQLTVKGKKKNATFTSNKRSVATVNKKNGKVTAKKKGTAVITARYQKKSYRCTITVKNFVNAKTVRITSPKSKTLKVGEETWIKQTVGPNNATVKDVTYKSSDAKTVKVGSKGKVRGRKVGSATITVTAKGGSAKATIKFTVKKATTPSQAPSDAPSQVPSGAPSQAPSDAPSQAPSGAPSDAPSQAPSETPSQAPSETPSVAPGELSEITDLKVTKADELTAVFGAAVPEDVEMSVANGEKKLEGTWKWDEGRTTAVFTSKGDLPTDTTVTVTATLGEKEVKKDVRVEARKVTEIKIINEGEGKFALTGKTSTSTQKLDNEAYIYYDVLDQYKESMRESETIEWTISPGEVQDNKNLGKLTVTNDQGFTYGNQIYLTGVHAKSGVTKTATITVGMSQEVDSLEFKGFVDKNDLTKIIPLDELPTDFAANTYLLLYQTFDQNGNPLEMDVDENRGENLVFLSDPSTLVENPEKPDGDKVITVAGEQYGGVKIEPGIYIDRGGEVTITAISNRTGKKTLLNLTIGEGGLLKSLVLRQPTTKVTNGEEVEIPYEATNTKGEKITNYETIARSTHDLKLTAAAGTLTLYEKNDGTAGLKWTDDSQPTSKGEGTEQGTWYTDSFAGNGTERSVALTSVVVNGESSNLMLPVGNTRRPTSVTGVTVNKVNDEYLVSGTQVNVGLKDMTFVDQYGSELPTEKVEEFFDSTKNKKLGGTEYVYGVKLDVGGASTSGSLIMPSLTEDVKQGVDGISFSTTTQNTTDDNKTVETESVKYSVVRSKLKEDGTISTNKEDWDAAGKSFSATYYVLPVGRVENPDIEDIPSKVQLGEQTFNNEGKISSDAHVAKEYPISVVGKYSGKDVLVPIKYWESASDSSINLEEDNGKKKISSVSSSALSENDLRDNGNYKEVSRPLRVSVKNGTKPTIIQSYVVLSDAPSTPTTIRYYVKGKVVSEAEFVPTLTRLYLQNNAGDYPYYSPTPSSSASPTPSPVLGKLKINVPLSNKEGDEEKNVVFDNYGTLLTSKEQAEGSDDTKPVDYGILVLDQYDQVMTELEDHKPVVIEYKISDILENTKELAHKPNSCVTTSNGTENVQAEGAEIGDTFKLQFSVKGTALSTTIKVTVGADQYANVASDTSGATDDEKLRKNFLGYNR